MAMPRHGQSTIEYIVVFAAVIACLIAFMAGRGSLFQNRLNETLNVSSEALTNTAQSFYSSF